MPMYKYVLRVSSWECVSARVCMCVIWSSGTLIWHELCESLLLSPPSSTRRCLFIYLLLRVAYVCVECGCVEVRFNRINNSICGIIFDADFDWFTFIAVGARLKRHRRRMRNAPKRHPKYRVTLFVVDLNRFLKRPSTKSKFVCLMWSMSLWLLSHSSTKKEREKKRK